jgi:hypothetical protein
MDAGPCVNLIPAVFDSASSLVASFDSPLVIPKPILTEGIGSITNPAVIIDNPASVVVALAVDPAKSVELTELFAVSPVTPAPKPAELGV